MSVGALPFFVSVRSLKMSACTSCLSADMRSCGAALDEAAAAAAGAAAELELELELELAAAAGLALGDAEEGIMATLLAPR